MATKPLVTFNTKRLELVAASEPLLLALLRSEEAFARELNVKLSLQWTQFGRSVFEYVRSKLRTTPEQLGWWTYFPILREERMLIGSGGFKGPPDADGRVEIGYEIAPDYRGRGLATEFAGGLVTWAFQHPQVGIVQAHTLPKENPSTQVLRKNGFQWMRTVEVGEKQAAWLWERPV